MAKTKLPAVESDRAILRAVRKAELAAGSGGTGYTILKQQPSPLGRLRDKRRIGSEELQAAEEIVTAFQSISGSLMLRPLNLERSDRSHSANEPVRVIDAVARYRAWARVWSNRAKRGDPTLEIVVAAVVDERPLRSLDEDLRLRNGTASKALVAGLKDYAVRAGWRRVGLVDGGGVFKLKRPNNERQVEAMLAMAREWDREFVPSPAA